MFRYVWQGVLLYFSADEKAENSPLPPMLLCSCLKLLRSSGCCKNKVNHLRVKVASVRDVKANIR